MRESHVASWFHDRQTDAGVHNIPMTFLSPDGIGSGDIAIILVSICRHKRVLHYFVTLRGIFIVFGRDEGDQ